MRTCLRLLRPRSLQLLPIFSLLRSAIPLGTCPRRNVKPCELFSGTRLRGQQRAGRVRGKLGTGPRPRRSLFFVPSLPCPAGQRSAAVPPNGAAGSSAVAMLLSVKRGKASHEP